MGEKLSAQQSNDVEQLVNIRFGEILRLQKGSPVKLCIAISEDFKDVDNIQYFLEHGLQNINTLVSRNYAPLEKSLRKMLPNDKKLAFQHADWDKHGAKAPYEVLNDMSHEADMLVVFWDRSDKTLYSLIRLFYNRNKPAFIFCHDAYWQPAKHKGVFKKGNFYFAEKRAKFWNANGYSLILDYNELLDHVETVERYLGNSSQILDIVPDQNGDLFDSITSGQLVKDLRDLGVETKNNYIVLTQGVQDAYVTPKTKEKVNRMVDRIFGSSN